MTPCARGVPLSPSHGAKHSSRGEVSDMVRSTVLGVGMLRLEILQLKGRIWETPVYNKRFFFTLYGIYGVTHSPRGDKFQKSGVLPQQGATPILITFSIIKLHSNDELSFLTIMILAIDFLYPPPSRQHNSQNQVV